MAYVLAALKALPALVGLVKELKGLIDYIQDKFDSPEAFIIEAAEAMKVVREAKSPEEKINAARRVQDLISKL